VPILVKITPTIIEMLTFNKWSSKVYSFYKSAFLLMFHGVDNDVSIWHNCCISKTKTKWYLVAKILF